MIGHIITLALPGDNQSVWRFKVWLIALQLKLTVFTKILIPDNFEGKK